jgi:hypothetical protein
MNEKKTSRRMIPRVAAVLVLALVGAAFGAGGGTNPGAGVDSLGTAVDSIPKADASTAGGDTTSYPNLVPVSALSPGYVGFGVGEKLVFSIQYGIVNAGEATLEIRNIAFIDDRPAYHIISDARSNEVFSLFFKVHDRYESFMDTTRLVSLRYEKHLREGKYKKDEAVRFDHEAHLAIYKSKTVPISPMTQDVLSALYYVRTLPLEIGKPIAVANHTDGKNYPILVKILRKERVTVEAGTFDCVVVEPMLQSGGVFQQKGKLTVWLTDDKYRIPVLMKSKVVIGSVAAVLKSYRLADKLD